MENYSVGVFVFFVFLKPSYPALTIGICFVNQHGVLQNTAKTEFEFNSVVTAYTHLNNVTEISTLGKYLNIHVHIIFLLSVNASCCETLGERFENAMRVLFSSWGSFCVRYPFVVIVGSLMVVVASSVGLIHMQITTDPVELWSSPTSQARQEKDYFDSHFGPFFRTTQLIITTPRNDSFIYSPYFGGSDVPFKAILGKDMLHQVGQLESLV